MMGGRGRGAPRPAPGGGRGGAPPVRGGARGKSVCMTLSMVYSYVHCSMRDMGAHEQSIA